MTSLWIHENEHTMSAIGFGNVSFLLPPHTKMTLLHHNNPLSIKIELVDIFPRATYIMVINNNNNNGVWPPERPSADLSSRRHVGDLRVCEDGALPRLISNAEDVTNTQPSRHRN